MPVWVLRTELVSCARAVSSFNPWNISLDRIITTFLAVNFAEKVTRVYLTINWWYLRPSLLLAIGVLARGLFFLQQKLFKLFFLYATWATSGIFHFFPPEKVFIFHSLLKFVFLFFLPIDIWVDFHLLALNILLCSVSSFLMSDKKSAVTFRHVLL